MQASTLPHDQEEFHVMNDFLDQSSTSPRTSSNLNAAEESHGMNDLLDQSSTSSRTSSNVNAGKPPRQKETAAQEASEELIENRAFVRKLLDVDTSSALSNSGIDLLLEKAIAGDLSLAELTAFLDSLLVPTPFHKHKTRKRHKPTVQTRRQLRRSEYAKYQNLFRRNRKKCASLVLDGQQKEDGFTCQDFVDAWKPIYTHSPPKMDLPDPVCKPTVPEIWKPITLDEVHFAFPSRGSSAGPDGISDKQYRKLPEIVLCAIFNLFLLLGAIPDSLNTSRTVFIPKKDQPQTASDFRPISVTPFMTRHFHRILANRLKTFLTWDSRQRAFLDNDGCAENIILLQGLLRDAYQKLKPLFMASIDLKKAFDSVCHEAVIRAFRRMGCPEQFVNYIKSTQLNASTFLFHNGETSDAIPINCGVRQGDPLSPYAFNAVLDELLSSLPPEIGFDVNGCGTNGLAFADDTNLIASSRTGLQKLLDHSSEFLKPRNLCINTAKSTTLSLVPNGKKKIMHVNTTHNFKIGDDIIPTTNVDEFWRYLGISINPKGDTAFDTSSFQSFLEKIRKAPLKPQQRIVILRFFLIPRFYYGLTLSNINVQKLSKLDKMSRESVRQWLHLPHDTPNGYFHADVGDGGLGVPSLRWCIPRMQLERQRKLRLREDDRLLNTVLNQESNMLRLSKVTRISQFKGTSVETKSLQSKMWKTELLNSVDGRGLLEASAVPECHRWISDGTSLLSGRDYINCIKMRINALPTRTRLSRGRDKENSCRAGCNFTETLSHVLQCCPKTHGTRVKRHDSIVSLVADKLRKSGLQPLIEPHYRTAEGLRKPDLVFRRGDLAHVLDVQVVADSGELEVQHLRKKSYYEGNSSLRQAIASELLTNNIVFSSVTLNWRGCISKSSAATLRAIGFPSRDLKLLSLRCIQGSLAEWSVFNTDTSRARNFRRP